MARIIEILNPAVVDSLRYYVKAVESVRRTDSLVLEINNLASLGWREMRMGGNGITLPSGRRSTRMIRCCR